MFNDHETLTHRSGVVGRVHLLLEVSEHSLRTFEACENVNIIDKGMASTGIDEQTADLPCLTSPGKRHKCCCFYSLVQRSAKTLAEAKTESI